MFSIRHTITSALTQAAFNCPVVVAAAVTRFSRLCFSVLTKFKKTKLRNINNRACFDLFSALTGWMSSRDILMVEKKQRFEQTASSVTSRRRPEIWDHYKTAYSEKLFIFYFAFTSSSSSSSAFYLEPCYLSPHGANHVTGSSRALAALWSRGMWVYLAQVYRSMWTSASDSHRDCWPMAPVL